MRAGSNAVCATVARFIVVALFFDAMLPLLPYMAQANGLSAHQFQWILGFCYMVFALVQLAAAPVIARCGIYSAIAWPSIIMGGAGLLLGTVADALLFSVLFILLFACNGIGANATRLALRAASSDTGFKRLLAWATAAIEIKQIAMPVLTGFIAASLGWRWSLLVLVLPVLLCGCWMQCASRPQQAISQPLQRFEWRFSAWLQIAAAPQFLMPTLLVASFELAFSPISARLPFVLTEELGLNPWQSGIVLSCASAAMALGLLASGYLAKWRSSRSLIKLGVLLVGGAALCMLAAVPWGSALAVAGMMILQLAFGFIVIPCAADVLNVPEPERIRASSLFGFVQPLFSGLVVALCGSVPVTGVQMAAVLSLCALGLLYGLLVHGRTRSVHAAQMPSQR